MLPQLIADSVQRAIRPSSSNICVSGFVGSVISAQRFDILTGHFFSSKELCVFE